MNKIIPEKEWGILNFELFEDKHKTDRPYPPDIVKKEKKLNGKI